MAKKASRRLVIDASVARACGGEQTQHPTGTRCREFLEAVRTISHQLVMTPAISEEWRRHQSRAARKWRVQMYARRKVCWVEPPIDDSLEQRINRVKGTAAEREGMLKDLPLIEAAKVTDEAINSLDDKVRRILARASEYIVELRSIVWVNPDQPAEDPIGWLQRGAKPERERMLGSGV